REEQAAKLRGTGAREQLPQISPERLCRRASELARRLAVEAAHAPLATDGIQAFAYSFQHDDELVVAVAVLTGRMREGRAEVIARHKERLAGWLDTQARRHGACGVGFEGWSRKQALRETIAAEEQAPTTLLKFQLRLLPYRAHERQRALGPCTWQS